jgi:hypothetical protein
VVALTSATKKKKPRVIGGDTGEYVGQAFSPIELPAAATAIKAAIPKTKGNEQKALERVFARLQRAYDWKAMHAGVRKQIAK